MSDFFAWLAVQFPFITDVVFLFFSTVMIVCEWLFSVFHIYTAVGFFWSFLHMTMRSVCFRLCSMFFLPCCAFGSYFLFFLHVSAGGFERCTERKPYKTAFFFRYCCDFWRIWHQQTRTSQPTKQMLKNNCFVCVERTFGSRSLSCSILIICCCSISPARPSTYPSPLQPHCLQFLFTFSFLYLGVYFF